MAANDHFSPFAATYAQFRPSYPDGLFAWLVGLSPTREHAWDCATGNGQAAISLAAHFDRVTATDVGAAMIAQARPHPCVTYLVGSAEEAPVADGSVDLITVAQALHWFDLSRFWVTCQRVLRPGGLLAYWGYLLPTVSPEIDALIRHYHDDTVGPFWPEDRGPLMNLYADVTPPADRVGLRDFTMTTTWTADQLIGMLESWSATHRMRRAVGIDPIPVIADELRRAWGDSIATRIVCWPLRVHVFCFNFKSQSFLPVNPNGSATAP